MKKHFSVKELARGDRPREKMLLKGREALSDSELIAILLGSGTKEESVLELSKRILKDNNNSLLNLTRLSLNDWMKYKGIGEAKAVSVVAALELGNRIRSGSAVKKKKLNSSKDVFHYFKGLIGSPESEYFYVLLLDRNLQIIKPVKIGEGGFAGTVADPKKIFKIALEYATSSIILCHNHPSGNIEPSQADINLTKKIVEAGKILDISVLDHIILGEDTYYSFADKHQIITR